jgi:hypothetical protein
MMEITNTVFQKLLGTMCGPLRFLFIAILLPYVWSVDCSLFTVVPGSVFNYAYNDANGVKGAYDSNWCKNNIHPNATYPVLRDIATQQFIANIAPWGWIGVYQQSTTNGDSQGWVWIDGFSQDIRPVPWDVPSYQPYGTGQCAHIAPGSYAWKRDCAQSEHHSCEINGKFALEVFCAEYLLW